MKKILIIVLTFITTYIHNYHDTINDVIPRNHPDAFLYHTTTTTPTNHSKHTSPAPLTQEKKSWTIIIYMAADNDLRSFAIHNLRQMTDIGSTEHCNIFVHLDIRITGNQKITRRYLIEKDHLATIGFNDQAALDSGNPETLISCCQLAIQHFPADHYALILWDHGTGYIEPISHINTSPRLFSFDQNIKKFVLNRNLKNSYFNHKNHDERGICWDSSTGNYLTNQKLDYALKTITSHYLGGKKFDIFGFDACLMNMLEVAATIKNYANIMVGSEEVELAMGWKYDDLFTPFIEKSMTPETFAKHMVTSYAHHYEKITSDYTQSALNLKLIEPLEKNLNHIATVLIETLKKQEGRSVNDFLWSSHSKAFCTCFHEPSFIDMHHFYDNMELNIHKIRLTDKSRERIIKDDLIKMISEGKKLIQNIVLINKVGKNLNKARGISLYFPQHAIHNSYHHSHFALTNNWYKLISHYLNNK